MKPCPFCWREKSQTSICQYVCVHVHVCLWMLVLLPCHGLSLHVVSNSESSRLESTLPSWLAITDLYVIHVYELFAKCCLVLLNLWHVPASNSSLCERPSWARGGRVLCTFRPGVRLLLRAAGTVTSKDEGHRPCLVSMFQKSLSC